MSYMSILSYNSFLLIGFFRNGGCDRSTSSIEVSSSGACIAVLCLLKNYKVGLRGHDDA